MRYRHNGYAHLCRNHVEEGMLDWQFRIRSVIGENAGVSIGKRVF
jgi:hypothetical protein